MKKQAVQPQEGKKVVKRIRKSARAPVRLWVKSVFLGFRRSKHLQNESQALLKIQGVNDVQSTHYYQGKRCAYVYKAHTTKNATNTKFRAIWGRVVRSHGSNGVVIARFQKNLPPRAISSTLRVFLYPQRTTTAQQLTNKQTTAVAQPVKK